MSGPTLSARGVGYRVDDAVLVDGVDLEVRSGEVLGIVGPNGAGKSTLIKMLAGEIVPSTGEVRLDGKEIGEYRPVDLAKHRAVLPQSTVLQFAFRVLDVVMMGRYPHREATPLEDEASVAAAMEKADVGHLEERLFPTLSGGEQARVSFARVLAQETRVVLLDEPSASLDVRHQELVMAVLRAMASDGCAIAAVLHDLNLAARHADRVAVMSGGRLVEVGPTSQVIRSDLLSEVYRHPVAVVPHPQMDCPLVLPLRA
ncbi:MAG: heme ABC transporter ATP-binding protein [Acidimicrobiia bacterium]|nr:heme ABC transporter ATP-binding protein [Acidimicrobiia bacterium]